MVLVQKRFVVMLNIYMGLLLFRENTEINSAITEAESW